MPHVFAQISSGQCPDRSRGTDAKLRALLQELYPVLVMNIATNNVLGGKIDVSGSHHGHLCSIHHHATLCMQITHITMRSTVPCQQFSDIE